MGKISHKIKAATLSDCLINTFFFKLNCEKKIFKKIPKDLVHLAHLLAGYTTLYCLNLLHKSPQARLQIHSCSTAVARTPLIEFMAPIRKTVTERLIDAMGEMLLSNIEHLQRGRTGRLLPCRLLMTCSLIQVVLFQS